ncbi:MAG: protein kinase [Lysobacteraceae bacterium]
MTAPVFDIPGYEFVRELGSGGMANVYLAIQRSLERRVAIKVMRRGLADSNTEQRFLNEGRTMARLPHPHIVGVYDIVQNDAINYIAMEYLEGGLLSERMRRGLSLAEAIGIVVQIAGALQFAHDNGVVHRDLKPSNVMFRDEMTAVLTDFGIARVQSAGASRLTQTGMMLGTPTYMSPEQATDGEIDGRADQYSLGVMFYEMLTGRPPFESESPLHVALAHVSQPPPPLPAQFAFFQPLMDRLLSKSPEQRFPDLHQFVRELKRLVTGSDTLLAHLQIDPSHSASEQLRALGFSDSQINTGARRVAGPEPGRAAASGSTDSSRAIAASGPGVRMGGRRAPPARPRWWLPAAGVGLALLIGIGVWLAFGGSAQRDLDPALRSLLNDRLQVVDRLIAEQQLVTPAGESAYDKLQEVLQLAPALPEARQRLDGIVAQLRQQAEAALAARNFDVAEVRIGEALAVAPADPALLALRQSIAAARVGAERQGRIDALLARASAAQRAGRLVGNDRDDAWSLIDQALQLDAQSAAALAARSALAERMLEPVRAALAAGRLDEAGKALDAMSAQLADQPAWKQASATLAERRQAAERGQRVDALLAQARRQLKAGRVIEPAGDNAVETLTRVVELDKANAEALRLQAQAATRLAALAREAEQRGDADTAFARYDQALQAEPGNPAYRSARAALEQRLGEQRANLARALVEARRAIAERRYFEPAGRSVEDYLGQALALEPRNPQALQLRAGLPVMIRESAQALAEEGRLADALALLDAAQRTYGSDREIAALAGRLQARRSQADAQRERESRLDTLRSLLARRIDDADAARAVVTPLAALLRADPRDADALRLRKQLVDGMRVDVETASAERLESLAPAVEVVETTLGAGTAEVRGLAVALYGRRQDVESQAQAQRLARQGLLLLDAYPWALVESVIDQSDGAAVELPADRSTPLRLPAQAGTYRVTFRHPEVGQAMVRVVNLSPKGEERVAAGFPTLSVDDYLKRAGYAP